MIRLWMTAAAVSGLLAVIGDAAARHAFAGDPLRAEWVATAARYGLIHAVALLALAGQWRHAGGVWLAATGWCFVAGLILFCGSLYLAAGGAPALVLHATPVGGTLLIAGWAALLLHALFCRRDAA